LAKTALFFTKRVNFFAGKGRFHSEITGSADVKAAFSTGNFDIRISSISKYNRNKKNRKNYLQLKNIVLYLRRYYASLTF
jgi:hypothetical protein